VQDRVGPYVFDGWVRELSHGIFINRLDTRLNNSENLKNQMMELSRARTPCTRSKGRWMARLVGKVAVVTGASKGIAAALIEALAAGSANVAPNNACWTTGERLMVSSGLR
jgi:3-oxoacyl-ACP reductase-like protein